MSKELEKTVIGHAEVVNFPELNHDEVPARIDTGAQTSSIWASHVNLQNGQLNAILFGDDSPHHHGKTVIFSNFDTVVVKSSTGHKQERYKVRLQVNLKGRKIRAWFTLADRSTQVYPVLIGRNVLRGKFLVDVKHGYQVSEIELERARNNNSQKVEEQL